jgi:hypothetical protein
VEVTTTLDTGPSTPAGRDPAAWVVERLAADLPSVGVAEVAGDLSLLARIDRKYVIPLTTLGELLAKVRADLAILEIDGLRFFAYETMYFDTADLMTYRAHAQGRRLRYKVRVRRYLDSDQSMLELKLKGARGQTLKHRIPYRHRQRDPLPPEARSFLSRIVGEVYGLEVPEALAPTVTTTTSRVTLVSQGAIARMTVDMDLECRTETAGVALRHDHVVVETKASGGDGRLDRALRQLGARPVAMSKYCLGVSVLHDHVVGSQWARIARSYFNPPTPVVKPSISPMP